MKNFDFRANNFDLIRLAAALQVVFMHGHEHFGVQSHSLLVRVVGAFPGVPIFFAISGFLISASWERTSSLGSYAKNRFLRIYPGLWVCLLVSTAIACAIYTPDFTWPELVKWGLAQVTIGQFYNPEFWRGYGVGVLNGSLWTIPVELQFYAILPVMYWILDRLRWNAMVVALLMAALVATNQRYVDTLASGTSLAIKLFGVTVIPYLYMFLFGILLQRNLEFVAAFLKDKVTWLLWIYAAVNMGTGLLGLTTEGNHLNPIAATVLALLTVSFAYSHTDKLKNILRGNDISYGVYIYHMAFVNALLHLSLFVPWANLLLTLILTIASALLSWRFVEKPSLALKSYSIYSRRRGS